MNGHQEKELETIPVKAYWVPLDVVPTSKPFLPQWVWHGLFVFSILLLLTVVLIARYPKKRRPGISMIQTQLNVLFSSSIGTSRPVLDASPKVEDLASEDAPKKMKVPDPKAKIRRWKQSSDDISKIAVAPKTRIYETNPKELAREDDLVPKAAIAPLIAVSPLERIRKDPKRLYMDKKFTVGDLTFEIRNVSEYGIELYVQNSGDARRTYYFPKVQADKYTSQFEGTVLEPGKGAFGWLIIPNLKEKAKLTLQFSVVGGDTKKESVRLEW